MRVAMNAESPRKRDADATRARILAAAQRAFWAHGYGETGIRDIAAIAETSSTLLLRYFGSKAGLFEAALKDAMQVEPMLAVGRDGFGQRLADLLLRPDLDVKPPAILAVTTSDAQALEITARVTEEQIIAPLSTWLGGSDARARALAITMLATGFVIYARQLPLSGGAADAALVRWFVDAVQTQVDGPR